MKLCSISIALLCAGALFSQELNAQEMNSHSAFCQNPLKKVCYDTSIERKIRADKIRTLKELIAQDARINAAPRIEVMKKEIKPIHFIKRAIARFKIINQETMRAAKYHIQDFETSTINEENINQIKEYLYQAIDESGFDVVTQNNLKQAIKSVFVGSFHDFLERTNMENESLLTQLLANPCGSDGMVENAFATTLNGQRYVLVCPGFLVTLSETPTASERLHSVILTLAHELGHHIDNGQTGNELYQPYLQCLADNHQASFVKSKADNKFCKKNPDKIEECHMQVALSHSGELIADNWGTKVLGLHMRTRQFTLPETEKLLSESWNKLCGTIDEGIHPSGDFRIGTMLRSAPEISNYLACDNSLLKNKLACTFEGDINL